MTAIFLLALALAPGLAIGVYIYLKDVHEPEPLRTLLFGSLCGVMAFFMAIGISVLITEEMTFREYDIIEQGLRAFLLVGLVEEVSKYAFLRGILFPHKDFNEPFDGIVYSVVIGLGFATAENIIYVLEGGASVAVVRMFTAVPAHAIFAVIMGFFLGEAKARPERNLLYSVLALVSAILIHGMYDYFLFISFIPGIWIGAVASAVIALVLGLRAIKLHQEKSPFK